MANGLMDSASTGKNNIVGAPAAHRDFRDALGRFATGVTVISSCDQAGRPFGITVNSFSSVSLEPPLILWCLERSTFIADRFLNCRHFAVNVLAATQKDIALRFAATDDNKFNDVQTFAGLNDLPLIHGALAHFECSLEQTYPGGDHAILLGRVERFSKADGNPLIFHRGLLAELKPES